MKSRRLLVFVMLFAVLCMAVAAGVVAKSAMSPTAEPAPAPPTYGEAAYEYMVDLSDGLGQRVAGGPGAAAAADYIAATLSAAGYAPVDQPFTYTRGGQTYDATNVIAVKAGKSTKRIVIGAHFDSVSVGRGAFDNASGVALMLQLASSLRRVKTPYTLVFVAFDAEEVGLRGSGYYVENLSAEELADTILMINFDSVAAGDQLSVYSDAGAAAWPQLTLRRIARAYDFDIQTNPGLNQDYPYGTTGDWSDHVNFLEAGVPYLYFEATNWLIGDLDGYVNSEEFGEIWHSELDTVAWIETQLPGRMEEQLNESANALMAFLTQPLPVPAAKAASPAMKVEPQKRNGQ